MGRKKQGLNRINNNDKMKYFIKSMFGLIFAFTFGCLISCKDEPTKPPTPFDKDSLRISVNDTFGYPVPGIEISVQDSAGRTTRIYLMRADLISNPDYYEMPPLPPACSFDVRIYPKYSLRTYPKVMTPDSLYIFRIKIQSCAYPLILKWKFIDQLPPEKTSNRQGASQFNASAHIDSGRVIIKDSNIDYLQIKLILNKKYSQKYRYPNPDHASIRLFSVSTFSRCNESSIPISD